MLHRLSKVKGFHIHATDGEVGHVDDFVLDETTWAVQYLVVDTSNFVGGKWVVISPSVIKGIDWHKLRVEVTLTRDEIKNGPTLENLNVPPAEKWPTHAFIF
jgi:sporulation protein YlmC with PRC-barrel domain